MSLVSKLQFRLSRILGSSRLAPVKSPNRRQVREEPDWYEPGGFHRVSRGDTFGAGKYSVLRKLGYGQYSTVWLAKDSKSVDESSVSYDPKCADHVSRYPRYVALKMLRAGCYGGPHDIFEREILSKISQVSTTSTHKGRHHVSPLLDHFRHTGPNGNHVCLVFDVLGHHMDFQTAKYADGRLPVQSVRTIARQLLLGLDFLHKECGVIHTGMDTDKNLDHATLTRPSGTDLKPSNILLELDQPDSIITEYLSRVPPRVDSGGDAPVPLREVITTPLLSEMKEPRIQIIDFGVGKYTWLLCPYIGTDIPYSVLEESPLI